MLFVNRSSSYAIKLTLSLALTCFAPSTIFAQVAGTGPSTEELAAKLVGTNTEEERRALLAAKKELVTVELRKALFKLADRQRVQGNYGQALAILQFTQRIAEQIGDKAGVAIMFSDIGLVHSLQDNYEQALESYERSLKMFEVLGDKVRTSVALNRIGVVHRVRGNYGLALDHYRRALALDEALGNTTGIARELSNIGLVHYSQGNYVQALEHYQQSLRLREVVGDKLGIAGILTSIGAAYESLGDYAEALKYHQQSLTQSEALGFKEPRVIALMNLGLVHRLQGRYNTAAEYYRKALVLSEQMKANRWTATALNEIALVYYAQNNYVESLKLAERAAALADQVSARETLWEARTTVGRAHEALNQLPQAHQSFNSAITIVEDLRAQAVGSEQDRQRFFEGKVSPYRQMVALLVKQNNNAEALAYAERAKARVLLDVVRNGRVQVTKEMTAQEQEQERKLQSELISLNTRITRENGRPQPDESQLANLRRQIQRARLEHEAFQTELYAAHPKLKAQRGEFKAFDSEQAAELLPDKRTALLEYTITDDSAFLFVLTRSEENGAGRVNIKVYPLGIKGKDLSHRTSRFREQLATRDAGFRRAAKELYELLLKPAEEQLQGKSSVVIVPDGALWEMPFQAFQTGANRYLIEDHAISYAPSLAVLREMIKTHPGSSPRQMSSAALLAFGNPALGKNTVTQVTSVYRDLKLVPLPEAEREVQTLAKLYGAGRSKVYLGNAAREELAKAEASRYDVVHMATHGILNDANPMYSNILLSQTAENSSEDGLLEAWEIMNMNLHAELVVLSACETARGRVGAGEGMIGLAWALFVAGTPTTVVSQWKVESKSTTELMLEFHRNLQSKPGKAKSLNSKAVALQKAALKLLRQDEYRHPFYWAGFVVVGDAR